MLGPLIFLIYINDLIDICSTSSEVYVFADDAKFFRHIFSVRYMSSSVRLSVCLSSVTFVHPTQVIEIFGMFLRHLVPWPYVTFR